MFLPASYSKCLFLNSYLPSQDVHCLRGLLHRKRKQTTWAKSSRVRILAAANASWTAEKWRQQTNRQDNKKERSNNKKGGNDREKCAPVTNGASACATCSCEASFGSTMQVLFSFLPFKGANTQEKVRRRSNKYARRQPISNDLPHLHLQKKKKKEEKEKKKQKRSSPIGSTCECMCVAC